MKGLAEYQENMGSPLTYEAERVMSIDGHDVGWVRYKSTGRPFEGATVMCECDFKGERRGETWVTDGSAHRCRYKKAARLLRALELQAEYDTFGGTTRLSGGMLYAYERPRFEAIILDVLRRQQAGEWVGNDEGSVLYTQTLGDIFDLGGFESSQVVNKVAREMMAEKRLAISGAMLFPWSEQWEPTEDDDSGLDDSKIPEGDPVHGKLMFHSETGTEGGYWALQDDAHTHGEDDLVDGKCPWGSDGCPVADGTYHSHSRYEGLRILRTGDYLLILDEEDGVAEWSGYIRLRNFPAFTESANGMWIHAEQRGVDRERWATYFTAGAPAHLIPKG